MNNEDNKGYLIRDIVGFYKYTADTPTEAWAEHMANDNSLTNISFIGTSSEQVRLKLIGWGVRSIKKTSYAGVYEVII